MNAGTLWVLRHGRRARPVVCVPATLDSSRGSHSRRQATRARPRLARGMLQGATPALAPHARCMLCRARLEWRKRKSPSGKAEALEILGATIPTRWLLCQKTRVRQYHRTPFSIKPRVSMLRASRFSTCISTWLLGRRGLDQTFAPVARLRAMNAMAVRCG